MRELSGEEEKKSQNPLINQRMTLRTHINLLLLFTIVKKYGK